MWSLYCDLSATLWKWSSELLILRTNIADKHSTIMGTGIVQQDQQPLQSTPPPKDEYLEETQPRQMLVIEDDSSLLAPLTIDEPERKETFTMTERP